MTPIEGKNVLVYFMKSSAYQLYACSEDISISFRVNSKPVKTIGDGVYVGKRGQNVEWFVEIPGLIILDEATLNGSFDLLDYLVTMSVIPFRAVFTDTANGLMKVVEGNVAPVEITLTGPAEGFSDGILRFEGAGAPSIRNTIETCSATIGTVFIGIMGGGSIDVDLSGVTGSPIRYEYWIDSGSVLTALSEPWTVTGIAAGVHTINIYPVCANGIRGTLKQAGFTI